MRRLLARKLNAIWYGDSRWRDLLTPLATLTCRLAARRRRSFLSGTAGTVELPVPVVVVGNLTAGGTGKTPLVIWLADALRKSGLRAGVISRGYRGRSRAWPRFVDADSDPGLVGDEPVLIARRTGVPVAVGPDRVAAARRLIEHSSPDVLIADDGLQHYRLGRCFEIAVVDGVRGLGNGLCMPAGPLREPPDRLTSVDAIVVNGGDWSYPGAYRMRLCARSVVALHRPEQRDLASFAGQSVHAIAGIGRPRAFFDMLEGAGLRVIAHPLDDHATISSEDFPADPSSTVLMTEKDAVKCARMPGRNVWAVTVDVEFDNDLAEQLLGRVRSAIKAGGQ